MSETAKVQANSAFGRVTLKAGMMEPRKNSPNPKRRNRGITKRQKIPPNPKRRNHRTAENTPKS